MNVVSNTLPVASPQFCDSRWTDAVKPGHIFREYQIYGVSLACEIPLSFPEQVTGRRPDITLFLVAAEWFGEFARNLPVAPDSEAWYWHSSGADGSHYVRWSGLFEFAISPDGRLIACRRLDRATHESFQTYLLGQALSFALVKQGHEPLHSTAVAVEGKAVAFLGESGYGKSTLAATFVHVGHRLITDDLLMLREFGGTSHAFPGPPRLKLFPDVARRFLPRQPGGAAMNPGSDKMVLPLQPRQTCAEPVPVHSFYVLDARPEAVDISLETLRGTGSFIEVIRSAFNLRLVDPARLRQQFLRSQRLLARVPIRKLTYPRKLDLLPCVRQAILADVRGGRATS